MVAPLSICLIENALSTNHVDNTNEVEQKIQTCIQTRFTGCLEFTIKSKRSLQWSLFFNSGRLLGGSSNIHPIRRWCRQIAQHCPQLTTAQPKTAQPEYWDQDTLVELIRKGKITDEQLIAIVEGNLVEILFDATRLAKQFELDVLPIHQAFTQNFLPAKAVFVQADRVWQQTEQAWRSWQLAGLEKWSPNWVPVIWDTEELRRQTSLLAYHNLTTLLDGDRTLRDIAIRLKQPPASLTQSLLPYIQKKIIGLVEVDDLIYDQPAPLSVEPTAPETPAQVRSSSPLVAYIEDSRFDSIAMSQILAGAGCRFVNIRDPVQALPILLERKPSLIFLDLLMPVTNGYEVCAQIRRISAFKDTPIIIVTSNDRIVDRVRAKLVGSSGFIAKPIESEKVLSTLRIYLTKGH